MKSRTAAVRSAFAHGLAMLLPGHHGRDQHEHQARPANGRREPMTRQGESRGVPEPGRRAAIGRRVEEALQVVREMRHRVVAMHPAPVAAPCR